MTDYDEWLAELYGESTEDEAPAADPEDRESEQPVVSPEQKMRAAMLANEAMKAEEAQFERDWRTGPGSGVLRKPAPLAPQQGQFGQVMPTSQGFMYVGNPVTPPEGWVSPQQQALDRGLASGLVRKPAPQPSAAELVQNPEYDAFQAQERYRIMLQATNDPKRAFAAAGPAILRVPGMRPTAMRGVSPYQQAQAEHWRNMDQQAKAKLQAPTTTTGTTQGPSQKSLESEIKAERDFIRSMELKQSETEQTSPSFSNFSYLLSQHRARLAELERQQSGVGTSTAPVAAPAPVPQATSPRPRPKIGDVVKGYRFKGGNVNDKNSWEPIEP
jgi:hypothetical protein